MTTARIAALITLCITFGLIAPNALADPPRWAPAHGWHAKNHDGRHHYDSRRHYDGRHHYVYYPAASVYYAPATRTWFWLARDRWHAGGKLPGALHGYVRMGGINVYLDVARPYLRNAHVLRRYGGDRYRWSDDRYDDDDDDDDDYYDDCDDDDCSRRYHRWSSGDDDDDD